MGKLYYVLILDFFVKNFSNILVFGLQNMDIVKLQLIMLLKILLSCVYNLILCECL